MVRARIHGPWAYMLVYSAIARALDRTAVSAFEPIKTSLAMSNDVQRVRPQWRK